MRYPKILASVLSLFFILSLAAAVFPAEFPQRPIRMIITYSAGGGTDVLGRAFQTPFEKALGGKIVIDCIPGGVNQNRDHGRDESQTGRPYSNLDARAGLGRVLLF